MGIEKDIEKAGIDKAHFAQLETKLDKCLAQQRVANRDEQRLRSEVEEAAEASSARVGAISSFAAQSEAALRSSDSLRKEFRAFGDRIEQEARSAKSLASHAEAAVTLFRREEAEAATRTMPEELSILRHDLASQEQKLDF